MRVVVTGGAGYIGSVVAEVLLADGHEVLVIDNLTKGHRDAVPREASFAHLDLLDQEAVTARLRRFGCQAVIHMAADSLVGESVVKPEQYYRNNVTAGLTLLASMRAAGVDRLVFSSSAAVYGEPAKQRSKSTIRRIRPVLTEPPNWRSSTRCCGTATPMACVPSLCAISMPPVQPRHGGSGTTQSPT